MSVPDYARLGGPGRPPTLYPDLFFITVDDTGQVLVDKQTYGATE